MIKSVYVYGCMHVCLCTCIYVIDNTIHITFPPSDPYQTENECAVCIMHLVSSGKVGVSVSEEIQYEMWIEWSLIWPVVLSACSHSAESGGFVEVSQQQLNEALHQRDCWETATTAVVGHDESTCYSKTFLC